MGRNTTPRTYPVVGPYTLQGRTLLFQTEDEFLSVDAEQALIRRLPFALMLIGRSGLKDVKGAVLSVSPLDGIKPPQWEIVMRVEAHTP